MNVTFKVLRKVYQKRVCVENERVRLARAAVKKKCDESLNFDLVALNEHFVYVASDLL
jgi:hypothetical protein